eukprot:sb/3474035/
MDSKLSLPSRGDIPLSILPRLSPLPPHLPADCPVCTALEEAPPTPDTQIHPPDPDEQQLCRDRLCPVPTLPVLCLVLPLPTRSTVLNPATCTPCHVDPRVCGAVLEYLPQHCTEQLRSTGVPCYRSPRTPGPTPPSEACRGEG